MDRRPQDFIVAAAAVLFAAAAGQMLALPLQDFVTNVIVDDALYFLVPARHFVAGQGFSFDGVYPTNGVQTLWAVVTIGIARVLPDTESALRVMCALSGGCWLIAGLLLWRGLRRVCASGAAFAACGFLAAGLHRRLAFQGMENGVHGLLAVLILVLGLRSFGPGGRRRYGTLGLAAGLFASCRTECVLLAVMLCVAIFFGYLAPPDPAPPDPVPPDPVPPLSGRHLSGRHLSGRSARGYRVHLAAAVRFGLPVLVIVGAGLLVSRFWFGSFTPVSGRVKMFYESQWADPRGLFANLGWHAKFLRGVALAPLSEYPGRCLEWIGIHVSGAGIRRFLLGGYVLGAVCLVVRRARSRARARRARARQAPLRGRFLLVAGAFVAVHSVLIATLLPHFTEYGTWYFSAEVLALWLLAAVTLAALFRGVAAFLWRKGRRVAARSVRAAFAVGGPTVIVLATLPTLFARPAEDPRTNRFLRAARWLDANLPPGQRVGALSAGLVGAFTTRHRVYNLDGLISSTEYFEEFLAKNRIHEFIDREQIRYFADYQSLPSWKAGITFAGRVPLQRLRLLAWWRLDGNTGYAIWNILPPGESHAVATGAATAVDALAELRFAAEVLDRYTVVTEDGLAAALRAHPDRVVVTSIPLAPSGALRHVLVNPEELARVHLPVAKVRPELACDIPVGSGVRLYGLDLDRDRVRRGGRVVVTRYFAGRDGATWPAAVPVHLVPSPVPANLVPATVPANLVPATVPANLVPATAPANLVPAAVPANLAAAAPGRALVTAAGTLCQGTFSKASACDGQAVVDACVLAVPADAARGRYRVLVGSSMVASVTVR